MISKDKIKGYKDLPQAKMVDTILGKMVDASNSTKPGVYCANCGHTFAYYTGISPCADGIDENGKAFYSHCTMCPGHPKVNFPNPK